MLNSVVDKISYSGEGVIVTLVDGTELNADYALVSFSLGVLQNDDVTWDPPLPAWKTEAVQSMTMVRDSMSATPSFLTYANRVHTQRSLCNSPRNSGSTPR